LDSGVNKGWIQEVREGLREERMLVCGDKRRLERRENVGLWR